MLHLCDGLLGERIGPRRRQAGAELLALPQEAYFLGGPERSIETNGGQEVMRTDTRTRIEMAAIAVLAEFGAGGFTAARLAETSGVSKANLYHHFSGLDEIVLASFERLLASMQMMHPPAEMTFEDWLGGLGEELVAMPPDRKAATRAYLVFFMRALADTNLRGKVIGALDQGHRMLAEILVRWRSAFPDTVETDQLARLVLVSGDGFLLHALMLEGRADELRPAWHLFVAAILKLRAKW